MRDRNKGFTLAELLIVVAIIAVLVAIAIPIFTTHLEKSRESVDMANARSAYSEVMTAALLQDTSNVNYEDGVYWLSIELKQKKDDWQSATPITIGGVKSTETNRWFGTTVSLSISWCSHPSQSFPFRSVNLIFIQYLYESL